VKKSGSFNSEVAMKICELDRHPCTGARFGGVVTVECSLWNSLEKLAAGKM